MTTFWAVYTGEYDEYGLEETFVSEDLARQYIELLEGPHQDSAEIHELTPLSTLPEKLVWWEAYAYWNELEGPRFPTEAQRRISIGLAPPPEAFGPRARFKRNGIKGSKFLPDSIKNEDGSWKRYDVASASVRSFVSSEDAIAQANAELLNVLFDHGVTL